MRIRKRNYVGVNGSGRDGIRYERFLSETTPTEDSHGAKYNAVIGPFVTRIGALAMVHFGCDNPHVRNVTEAERVGKKYATELAGKSDQRFIPCPK